VSRDAFQKADYRVGYWIPSGLGVSIWAEGGVVVLYAVWCMVYGVCDDWPAVKRWRSWRGLVCTSISTSPAGALVV
jgi:hypothetical protein